MGKALLFPLLSILVIIAYAGILGVLFMLLNHKVWEDWAVIILGVIITVGVPSIAFYAQKKVESS